MTQRYQHVHEIDGSSHAANVVAPLILKQFPETQSVLDIGGGVGAWLAAFSSLGVKDLELRDAGSVHPHLRISPMHFTETDLICSFGPHTKVDLAVCLEVAEHLPMSRSSDLVKFLTTCSDNILFSAAPPGQGGVNHINCQLLSFWNPYLTNKDSSSTTQYALL